jgi:hypothetical protein
MQFTRCWMLCTPRARQASEWLLSGQGNTRRVGWVGGGGSGSAPPVARAAVVAAAWRRVGRSDPAPVPSPGPCPPSCPAPKHACTLDHAPLPRLESCDTNPRCCTAGTQARWRPPRVPTAVGCRAGSANPEPDTL